MKKIIFIFIFYYCYAVKITDNILFDLRKKNNIKYNFMLPIEVTGIQNIKYDKHYYVFSLYNNTNVFSIESGKVLYIDKTKNMVVIEFIINNHKFSIKYKNIKDIKIQKNQLIEKGSIIGLAQDNLFVRIKKDDIFIRVNFK